LQGKERNSIWNRKIIYGIITVALLLSVTFIVYSLLVPANPTYQFNAAIIDQLSVSNPNSTFIESVTSILNKSGYGVDYYREVTVDLYRNLPKYGYGIIVFRVHSGLGYDENFQPTGDIDFSTSEDYVDSKYEEYQLSDWVVKFVVNLTANQQRSFFAITPKFVREVMTGKFVNTTILMMGCDGLTYDIMAKAFREKGAKVYISWKGSIDLSFTDQVTIQLLQDLLLRGQKIRETVNNVGQPPIPFHKSKLSFYPLEEQDYLVPVKIVADISLHTIDIYSCISLKRMLLRRHF